MTFNFSKHALHLCSLKQEIEKRVTLPNLWQLPKNCLPQVTISQAEAIVNSIPSCWHVSPRWTAWENSTPWCCFIPQRTTWCLYQQCLFILIFIPFQGFQTETGFELPPVCLWHHIIQNVEDKALHRPFIFHLGWRKRSSSPGKVHEHWSVFLGRRWDLQCRHGGKCVIKRLASFSFSRGEMTPVSRRRGFNHTASVNPFL